MKLLFCGFLAFLAFQNVQSHRPFHHYPPGPPPPGPPPPPPPHMQNFQSEYITAIRERLEMEKIKKQVNDICPGYGEKTENVTNSMKSCINDIDLDTETLCSSVKSHAVECTQPAVDLFEECLPKESKEIPSFVVKLLMALSDYLCKSDGEHLLELHNKCVLTSTYKFQRCIRKVTTFGRQISLQRQHLSVDNVCELMTSLKSCMTSHLNLNCGHPITRAAVIDLMDKAMSACPTVEVASNEVELVSPNAE